jgi:hypothetical protein
MIRVNNAIENFKTIIKIRMNKSKKDTRAIILFEFKKSLIPLPLPAVLSSGFHADEFVLSILSYIYNTKENGIITKLIIYNIYISDKLKVN